MMNVLSLFYFIDQELEFVTGTVPVSSVMTQLKQKLLPQAGDYQTVLNNFNSLQKQTTIDWLNGYNSADCSNVTTMAAIYGTSANVKTRLETRGVPIATPQEQGALAGSAYQTAHCQLMKNLSSQMQSMDYNATMQLLSGVYKLLNIDKLQINLAAIYSYIASGAGLDGGATIGFIPQLNGLITSVTKGCLLTAAQSINPTQGGLIRTFA
jgi:hypothetical protein